MKRTFTLIAILVFLSVALSGQIGKRADPVSKWIGKHLERDLQMNWKERNTGRTIIMPGLKSHQPHELKSMLETKQKLDFVLFERYEDSTERWLNLFRDGYLYDSIGRQIQRGYQIWDDLTGEWRGLVKREYTLDANGNRIFNIYFVWDPNVGQWAYSRKVESTFDANNNMTRQIDYQWIDSTGVWMAMDRSEYTYNSGGNLSLYIEYNWNVAENRWIECAKEEYTFNTIGKWITRTEYYWDDRSNAWLAGYKSDFTYDSRGNLSEYCDSGWDAESNQWVGQNKIVYTFDANNRAEQYFEYSWDIASAVWILNYRDVSYFDDSGNMIRIDGYLNDSTNQMVLTYRSEYTYDNAFAGNDLILPELYFQNEYFTHKLVDIVGWYRNDSTSQWVPLQRERFLYSEININSISETGFSKIRIFPNPATDVIILESDDPFETSRFELTDMQGRKVVSEMLDGTRSQISVAELSNGIYLYQIIKKGEFRYGKIVIR